MKTNDKPQEIDTLLDALEQHGRDLRRQQQLAAMIDSMASTELKEESGKWRVVRLWSMRVAAAACMLFFIVTAARVWLIPTGEPAIEVAVADKVPVYHDEAAAPIAQPAPMRPAPQRIAANPKTPSCHPVEKVERITYSASAPEAEPDAWIEAGTMPVPEPPVEALLAEEPAGPQAEPSAEGPRQSILKSLFRRPEPSHMDGTMLAINLL